MSPIPLNREERAALSKLVRRNGTIQRRKLQKAHAERFISEGLIWQDPQRYHLTLRGQVEVLRQRYRGVRGSGRGVTVDDSNSVLDREAFG